MKTAVTATLKNEGPYIWEWVAHHQLCGFDSIIIVQNNSDDLSYQILKTLDRIGAIEFRSHSPAPEDQRRLAFELMASCPGYKAADWVLNIDMDEFLNVKTGDNTIQDLIPYVKDFDQVLLSWRMFGASGLANISQDLVTERFTAANDPKTLITKPVEFKSLFQRKKFERPGVHDPYGPKGRIRKGNGSGLGSKEFKIDKFRASDPGGALYADVHHYSIRDAAAFTLKDENCKTHHTHRTLGKAYWTERNYVEAQEPVLAKRARALRAQMRKLDNACDGRLTRLSRQSFDRHITWFRDVLASRSAQELFLHCVTNERP